MYILHNSEIRNLWNFLDISDTRYITFLSFALNYLIGGYNPLGYHLVNITIHIINGLLVWSLVTLTLKTPVMERGTVNPQLKAAIALTAALIFITHPIQTQAVTYITQRFASLATLFYLLCLVLFARWRISRETLNPGPRTFIYASSIFSAVLAMKTKEISFTLPFVIILYEFTFFSNFKRLRRRLLYLVPFLLTLAIIPLNYFAPELGLGERGSDISEEIRRLNILQLKTLSRHDYLITQFGVIVTYIRLLILPVNQNVDYDYPLYNSFFNPEVLLSFLFLISIFGFALFLFARSRKTGNGYALMASFGILWFFITLSVESSMIALWDVIFEHRVYLPSVGLIITFSTCVFYGFDYAKERLGFKVSILVFTCAVLLVSALPLSLASYSRNLVWEDEITFWEDVARKSPGKMRGHYNLGVIYNKRGRMDEAIENYKKAIRLKPDFADAHNNLGLTYSSLGRTEEAIGELILALTG
jgi:tetratricopeptide (TPR) repeat protein